MTVSPPLPTSTTPRASRPPAAGETVLPLVWYGPLLEPSGYAEEGRAFLLALERAGRPAVARETRTSPVSSGAGGDQLEAVLRASRRPLPQGEHVAVFHAVPRLGQPLVDGAANVARTMFETTSIPRGWVARLLEVDEVWVPCSFNVDTFERGGVPRERLRVLPETIDFELFQPGHEPLPLPGRRKLAFLASFDFSDRKGWDVLLDAWADAFPPGEDVCLVLKCLSLSGMDEKAIRARIDSRLGRRRAAPVLILADVLSPLDLARLYASVDAYVLPSRGEAWGRPYMEAMAMGLPTIASRFGGVLDFMHEGNSWLVEGEVVPVPKDALVPPHYHGQRWFEPDREALAEALLAVAAGGPEVAAKAASAREELVDRFGPEAMAAVVGELARDLLARRRERRAAPTLCAWRGPWGRSHSLAVVNDGIARALEAVGSCVLRQAPDSPPTVLDVPTVSSCWPPSFAPGSSGPLVLYQPWEYGEIPVDWVEEIRRRVDEVWTPSERSRQAFLRSGISPELVHVVPNGVDLDRFTPHGPRLFLPTDKGTVFLFVGGTIYRKGIDILLTAFARAFRSSDDVALVVKGACGDTFYRGQTAEDMLRRFRSLPDAPELIEIEEDLSAEDMPSLYRAAHVLVQPYRGEGFCLPVLEALACGLPVIVTAGGPTDDVVTEACAWRLPARPAPLPPSELRLTGEGELLEPDLDALVEALRRAADPKARAEKAEAARLHAQPWSWDRAAAQARRRLQGLAGRVPVRLVHPAGPAERRGILFAVHARLDRSETWEPALLAYARAFPAEADTTLAVAAPSLEGGEELLARALARAGIDPAQVADVALVQAVDTASIALELAADAFVECGRPPVRARRIVPASIAALQEAARLAQKDAP